MMRRRDVLSAALAASAFAAPGSAAAQTPANRERIAALLAGRIDAQRRGTGAAAGLVQGRRTTFVSHGVIAADRAEQPQAGSAFQIASLTKVFTALLLTDAVLRGDVALDDPVSLYLPVAAPTFEGRAITLLDLATHASGLPLRPASRVDRSQDNPYAGYTRGDLYADIAAARLSRAPGAAFEYSNFGYGVLGAALCNRLERSYWELLRTRILDPLDMNETRLTPTPRMRRGMVQGYDADLAPMQPWEFGDLAPAGGLYSTIGDLGKFLRVWTGGGRLSQAGRAMLSVARAGDNAETSMAIGWRLAQRQSGPIAWSNGSGGGVRCFMAFRPGASRGVAAFANMATGMGVDDIGFHALDASYPVDVTPVPVRTAISVPGAVLDRYVGDYVYAPGDTMTIARLGDGIAFMQGQSAIPLLAETETLFFMREDNVTFEFSAPADGPARALLTQAGQRYEYVRR